jgi:putative ATP-dependent endonuclease of OLD family
VPTFYLASLRHAAQEFRPKSQFWGPFVRALNLEEIARTELECALSELNKKVLEQHTTFANVKERLKKTAELLPLGEDDPVSIVAVPSSYTPLGAG